jgi:thiamine pyrophosphate-dependent acetolactate synthase large subunit-like protein
MLKLKSDKYRSDVDIAEAVSIAVAARSDAQFTSSLGTSTSALRLATEDGPHAYLGGAMGSGLPWALGIADRLPDREIVGIVGDGDLLMGASSLWSLAGLALPNLTVLVMSDGAYAITGGQELVHEAAAAAVAMSLGIPARRVESADALRDALADPALRLIEVAVRRGADWPGPSSFVDTFRVKTRFLDAVTPHE